jgi:hypothetical protein
VKTYGYTLMLAKEKLEDEAKKKIQLERNILAKKLQLMEEMRNKLQLLRGTRDLALEKRISEQQHLLSTLTPEADGRRQLSVLQ